MAQKVDNLTGDVGAMIRGAFKAGKLYGLPRESDYPYNLNQYGTEPSDAIKALAAQRKGGRYERIDVNKDNPAATDNFWMLPLAEGCRVVMGFDVYRWMLYVTGAMNTHHPTTRGGQQRRSAVGLRGASRHFIEDFDKSLNPTAGGSYIAVNSWGTGWGDGGRWAIPLKSYYHELGLRVLGSKRVLWYSCWRSGPRSPVDSSSDCRRWELGSFSQGPWDAVNGNFEYIGVQP